ncbi:MAG: desulfoferrodoxin [Microgenomates group bacterium]
MIQNGQVYKCNVCGNIVEVLYAGGGQLVCCGQPMEMLREKTQDVGQEKHLPVLEETAGGVKVRVGSISHPMEETHFIQWIEAITKDGNMKRFLNPGDQPEAEFSVKEEEILAVREFCNIHGLWKG